MHRVFIISGILILWLGLPARSQFTQYTAPGTLAQAPEDAAEGARQEAENARWKIGPLRVQPHLTLSNVGYEQNVFAAPEGTTQVDDSHASLGAGLVGYVRLGSRSLLSAFVAPEYTWWQDSEDLRRLSVNSGLAWFGSFNRLTLSARAPVTETEKPLSSELEAPVQISEDSLSFDATLEITRRLALFGIGSDSEVRHATDAEQFVPGLDLQSLDRDTSRRVVGIELRGSDVELGLGYETTEVDFVASDERDNSGEGPSARLSYDRSRLKVYLTYADLKIDFEDPALFDTQQTIGTALVAYRIRPDTTASVYAADGLAFTVISSTGIIESESRGLTLAQGFGERLEASVFAERGRQKFVDSQNPGRVDDLEAFGLGIRFELTERLTLTGQFREETWDSTFDDFDRPTSSLSVGIQLGGDLLPW